MTIFEELGDKYGIATNLGNIGHIYSDQAISLSLWNTTKIRWSSGKNSGIRTAWRGILNNIGILCKKEGKNASALNYCQKSLALAEIGALDLQKDACQCLYNNYKAMGKDKDALAYYEQMIAVRDSMFNEENTKKLTQLEMQYEFDKKEATTKAEQERKMPWPHRN
ncbi:MAG: tetratricopeptide repeat protein [Bacteroidia bacterium]